MSKGSRVHAYFLLMARLAAIWSILPPPSACSSPLSHLAGLEEHRAKPHSSPTKPPHEAKPDFDDNSPSDFPFSRVLRERRSSDGAEANASDTEAAQVQSPKPPFPEVAAPAAANETHEESASALDNDTTYDYFLNDTALDLDHLEGSGQNSTDGSISNIKVYEFQIIKVAVLCTVMSIIILSTCKMLLQVFAQYAGREKPPEAY